jgi:hypothetical protein
MCEQSFGLIGQTAAGQPRPNHWTFVPPSFIMLLSIMSLISQDRDDLNNYMVLIIPLDQEWKGIKAPCRSVIVPLTRTDTLVEKFFKIVIITFRTPIEYGHKNLGTLQLVEKDAQPFLEMNKSERKTFQLS